MSKKLTVLTIIGLTAILIVALVLNSSAKRKQFLRKLCREDLPQASLFKKTRDLSGELFSCPNGEKGEKEKCFHLNAGPKSGGHSWAFRYLVKCGKKYYVVDGSSIYQNKVFGPFKNAKDLKKFEDEEGSN